MKNGFVYVFPDPVLYNKREMNPVETEFYEVLKSGCPDKMYLKYYLKEANDRLEGMSKKEREKLNIEFEKETSRINGMGRKEPYLIIQMDKKEWAKEMNENILKKNIMQIL